VLRRRRHDDPGDPEPVELAALADGSLAPERRTELEADVASSAELGARLAEQRRALSLVRDAADEVEAPAGLRARIEAQRSQRRSPRTFVLAGSAATVAALAVAVVLTTTLTGPSYDERFHTALAGTTLAAGAQGNATLTKTTSGWRIELHATGLPRLDGGRFYEAWLKNDAGTLVPIGTFNEGENVTLWAGVSPKTFATLTVTRELADGNQASSGQKVLVGTVDTSS
jgi:anti-sigma-K factor RskA